MWPAIPFRALAFALFVRTSLFVSYCLLFQAGRSLPHLCGIFLAGFLLSFFETMHFVQKPSQNIVSGRLFRPHGDTRPETPFSLLREEREKGGEFLDEGVCLLRCAGSGMSRPGLGMGR